MEIKMKDAIRFYEDLQAIGTENYYRTSFIGNCLHTDGVELIFQKLSCYWLGDVVVSYLPFLAKSNECFFSVKVILKENRHADFSIDDGNGNLLVTQEIPFTDLNENIHLFFQLDSSNNFVLMLPSEY